MKKQIYILLMVISSISVLTACNNEIDNFEMNTVEGIETLANSGTVTESLFNRFVKDARSNTLLFQGDFTLYFDDHIDPSDNVLGGSGYQYPYHEYQNVLLCDDGTGRVCYRYWVDDPSDKYLPPYNKVYRVLEWTADTKSKSIIFCDKRLQKKGYDTAVTSLTLKYYDKKSGLYVVKGTLPLPRPEKYYKKIDSCIFVQ